jgi:hypothetical protein
MRTQLLPKLIMALLGCTAIRVQASSPPPAKTFAERVDMATHVIIGTAKSVKVVQIGDNADGSIKVQEVIPEPEHLDPSGRFAEIEIEVNEVLFPTQWKAPKTVRYLFGGGHFEVKSIREDVLNEQHLFLMQTSPHAAPKNAQDIFFPSYGWHLYDSVESKAEVQKYLKPRIEQEQKPASKDKEPK